MLHLQPLEVLSVGSCVSWTYPYFREAFLFVFYLLVFYALAYFLVLQDVPSSSCIFPALVIESSLSPKNLNSFQWSCCCSVIVSRARLFATPWTAACQAPLSSNVSRSLLKCMSIELMMLSNHSHPLLLLPSTFASIRVFSNVLALCIRWPKYWSFSISPSNEYSGLISFRIDWFDFCTVQGTLKSLLKHHNLKVSVLWWSAFFMAQLFFFFLWPNSYIHTWLLEKP